jgi:hypothetical protein
VTSGFLTRMAARSLALAGDGDGPAAAAASFLLPRPLSMFEPRAVDPRPDLEATVEDPPAVHVGGKRSSRERPIAGEADALRATESDGALTPRRQQPRADALPPAVESLEPARPEEPSPVDVGPSAPASREGLLGALADASAGKTPPTGGSPDIDREPGLRLSSETQPAVPSTEATPRPQPTGPAPRAAPVAQVVPGIRVALPALPAPHPRHPGHGGPGQAGSSGGEHVVQVTIGRVEVKAVPEPAPARATKAPPARRAGMSLNEYLQRRSREGR